MKLLSLKANNVYGYLNLDIHFGSELTILTGLNGSGKTTSLVLLFHLFNLDLERLASIKFNTIEMTYEHKGIVHCLSIKKAELGLVLKIPTISKKPINYRSSVLVEYPYMKDEIIYYRNKSVIYELPDKDNAMSALTKHFKELSIPNFLFMDRRDSDPEQLANSKDPHRYRDDGKASRTTMTVYLNEGVSGSLDLIQNEFKEARKKEDKANNMLIKNLFLSSMTVLDVEEIVGWRNAIAHGNMLMSKETLRSIEQKLMKVIQMDDQVTKKIHEYFVSITKLLKRRSEDNFDFDLEILVNFSQLSMLNKIGQHILDCDTEIARAKEHLHKLLSSINSFLSDTGKIMLIDPIGRAFIQQTYNGNITTIDATNLSSGEKQLIIILTHMLLKSVNKNKIFIIDEPELSLHLAWQEKLLSVLMQVNSRNQVIIATHSPEIIADYGECVVDM